MNLVCVRESVHVVCCRVLRARCDPATLICASLGALVLVGAYICLPAYIYASRLKHTHCST